MGIQHTSVKAGRNTAPYLIKADHWKKWHMLFRFEESPNQKLQKNHLQLNAIVLHTANSSSNTSLPQLYSLNSWIFAWFIQPWTYFLAYFYLCSLTYTLEWNLSWFPSALMGVCLAKTGWKHQSLTFADLLGAKLIRLPLRLPSQGMEGIELPIITLKKQKC